MPDPDLGLNDFKDDLEKDSSYLLCVGGMTVIGMAVMGLATQSPLGVAGGAAVGALVGLWKCPSLSPAIRSKFFSANARMTPAEFGLLVRQVRVAYPQLDARQTLDLIARERHAVLTKAQC